MDACSADCVKWSPDEQAHMRARRGAAMEALDGPANAHLQAVAKAAAHRLKRGVWTSPGAGDIRRALAATERLVLLAAAEESVEAGAESSGQNHRVGSGGGGGGVASLGGKWERRDLAVLLLLNGEPGRARAELARYVQTGSHFRNCDPADAALVERLQAALAGVEVGEGEEAVSIEGALAQAPPDPNDAAMLPLTW
jgi:hypothetical protein